MKHLFRLNMVLLSMVLLSACSGDFDVKGNNWGDGDTTMPDATHLLKKTGQTKSYNENGVEMTDNSIKDDGYYQKGITPNYTRDTTKKIVSDTITGLQWQDDAAAKTLTKNWADAQTYCSNLALGGYSDWRLPVIDELMDVADRSKRNPAIDPTFQNARSEYYWSSTSVVGDENVAWRVNFDNGIGSGYHWNDKSSSLYVRCVRGKEANMENRYTRSEGIVTDRKTGLQWQDNYNDNNNIIKYATWTDAIEYCEDLALGGHNDWRLPNFNELYSLVDLSKHFPAIDATFQHVHNTFYWSSTSIVDSRGKVWVIHFENGNEQEYDKSGVAPNYVRCVRAGE